MNVRSIISFTILLFISVLQFSCKSEFEKIRSSGDVDRIYTKAFEYYEQEEYQKAQTLFELIIASYRGRKEAEEMYFKYAYTYYYLNQFILAAYYFKSFSQTYSTSKYREESDFMVAYSNYRLSPTFRLDQSYTKTAIEGFQLFINTFSNSERVNECNRLIDELRLKLERKGFEEGKLYFDLRYYQSSVQSFENLLKDFPETRRGPEIRYFIVRSAYLLAENSVVDKQEERYLETIKRAKAYLKRYPKGDFTKDVADIEKNATRKLNKINNDRYQNESAGIGS